MCTKATSCANAIPTRPWEVLVVWVWSARAAGVPRGGGNACAQANADPRLQSGSIILDWPHDCNEHRSDKMRKITISIRKLQFYPGIPASNFRPGSVPDYYSETDPSRIPLRDGLIIIMLYRIINRTPTTKWYMFLVADYTRKTHASAATSALD